MSEYESNDSRQEVDVDYTNYEPLEGAVTVIKPSIWKKLMRVFFQKDIKDAKEYLLWGVFLPNLRLFMLKNIYDAFGGEDFYPGSLPRISQKRSSGSWLDDNVSYAKSGIELPESFGEKPSVTPLEDIENLGFQSPKDASKVHQELYKIAKSDNSGCASLADLCKVSPFFNPVENKIVRVNPKWSYNDWGWTLSEIENAVVRKSGGLWIITLPQARDIRYKKR